MPPGDAYRPFCLADRPNHVRILQRAAERTGGFGVLTQATVTDTVIDLIAELDVPVVVDCGVFSTEDFEGGLRDLFDVYDRMDADYGLIPDVIGERISTDKMVEDAGRLWRGGQRWGFEPVGVAQGECPADYAASFWDCYQLGVDHIAVGGLLDQSGERSGGHATARDELFEAIELIRGQHRRIWRDTWTFALGCDHPQRRPRLAGLGLDGADSKWWLFQYDSEATASREEQLVNVVVRAAWDRTQQLSAFGTNAGEA